MMVSKARFPQNWLTTDAAPASIRRTSPTQDCSATECISIDKRRTSLKEDVASRDGPPGAHSIVPLQAHERKATFPAFTTSQQVPDSVLTFAGDLVSYNATKGGASW